MKKYTIAVREKGLCFSEPGKVIATIIRKPWTEWVGNFMPVFCRYKKKIYLVHSLAGDLSDPFRREQHYLQSLYIEI